MGHKKLAIRALVILLVAGVAGVSASAPDASSAPGTYSHGVQGIAQEVPAWQQVNSSRNRSSSTLANVVGVSSNDPSSITTSSQCR